MVMATLDVPKGCLEIPGVILVFETEKRWVTKEGLITDNWKERGVWATEQDANNFLNSIFNNDV